MLFLIIGNDNIKWATQTDIPTIYYTNIQSVSAFTCTSCALWNFHLATSDMLKVKTGFSLTSNVVVLEHVKQVCRYQSVGVCFFHKQENK